MKRITIDELVGETLTHIDVTEEDDCRILLTTESGRQIALYHEQDCCESVWLKSVDGDWTQLVGKPVLLAEHVEEDGEPSKFDHCTETTITFKVTDATVTTRWIGESNGYYSESVDISELVGSEQVTTPRRRPGGTTKGIQ